LAFQISTFLQSATVANATGVLYGHHVPKVIRAKLPVPLSPEEALRRAMLVKPPKKEKKKKR